MSIWNGLTKEQEAFKAGLKDGKEDRESIGAMVVNAFQSIGSGITTSRDEREAYEAGREFERRHGK